MSFIKYAEFEAIKPDNIKTAGEAFSEFDVDLEALEQFKKIANELKRVAPKAKDFLYFTAIFMHAAEASIINDDGTIKKDANGNDIIAEWDIDKENNTWKWKCSSKDIMPLKNSNGDIFPEIELKKAYKKWVGKPLCVDHRSSESEAIRGIIVDTFYDEKYKRIIGLCAADKIGYPQLCRSIAQNYTASVSMGTAVSEVFCSSCGKGAKIESDFCKHLKDKSRYGEINTGLSPIELSVVVNGADPKAKIRHIVAATNSIAKYVDQKETLVAESKDMMSAVEVEQLESDLAKAQETLAKLKKFVSKSISEAEKEEDTEKEDKTKDAEEKESKSKNKDEDSKKEDDNEISDSAYGQPGMGSPTMKESDVEMVNKPWSAERYASSESDINKVIADVISNDAGVEKILQEKIENYTNKIALIQSAIHTSNKDLDMTTEKKAYFQGAGDVNEPTPGQVKYPKEDSDSIREKDDKQMQPQTNNGKIDGLVDGDEALKKKLLRASNDVEARQIRRDAALDVVKKAYFQGGGDVNEPTPGKPKYPKEDSDKIREKEDKQMNGESPFPGVGKTDSLYGDDLKTKQMLARAKLNANFIKAANSDGTDNAGESRWQVFADKKLILTATVADIAGKDKADFMFDSIATKEFGKKILSTIKTEGFDKAVSLFKGAQEVPASVGPGADVAGPGASLPMEMPKADEEPSDAGDKGDPLEQVDNQVNKMDNLVADMKQAVDALKNEDTSDLDSLAPVAASDSSVSMSAMRKTLNASLQKGIKQAMEELNDQIEEHNLIKNVYERDSVPASDEAFVAEMVASAVDEAEKLISKASSLKSAFVKYARGTDALVKKANAAKVSQSTADVLLADDFPKAEDTAKMEKDLKKIDEKVNPNKDKNHADVPHPGEAGDPNDWKSVIKGIGKDLNPNGPPAPGHTPPPNMKPKVDPPADMFADDSNSAVDFTMKPDGSIEGKADKLSEVHASNEPDLLTKEGRAEMRAKLAQKGLKFSDILDKAHPQGGFTTKLDTKPEGDLAKVEDLEEKHNKMLEIANKAPTKVREAAATIQKLVVAGKINPEKDFDGLVAQGLDSAAVSYWKKFYGEAKDGGSQFAAELVKDHETKKKAEEMETYRVKVARAYDVAHDMASRGMIASNREAVTEQVKEMTAWSDAHFDSMKRVIDRTPVTKTASALPAVGYETDYTGVETVIVPAKNSGANEYDQIFAGRKLTGRSF